MVTHTILSPYGTQLSVYNYIYRVTPRVFSSGNATTKQQFEESVKPAYLNKLLYDLACSLLHYLEVKVAVSTRILQSNDKLNFPQHLNH